MDVSVEKGNGVLLITAPFMILISTLLLYLMKTKKKITKNEGIVLLIGYAIFLILVIITR